MRMPKTKRQFESDMIYAFLSGMNAGYGVEHTNISHEENKHILDFITKNKFTYATMLAIVEERDMLNKRKKNEI